MTVYAGFHLDGADLLPEEVTRCTGLTPDTTYSGDHRLPSGRMRGHGSWALHTRLSPRDNIEHAIDDLYAALVEAWPELVRLGSIHEARICLVVQVPDGERYPPTYLRRDQVERASQLSASIDVDGYDDRGSPHDIR